MAVECDWAILCDYAFLDVGRKMCLVGIFDRIFAPSIPAALHQSALAFKLLGQPGESANFKVEIMKPSGGELASFGGLVQISDTGGAEIQVNVAGLPLPDYGLYSFNIVIENSLEKSATFVVTQPPTAQQ